MKQTILVVCAVLLGPACVAQVPVALGKPVPAGTLGAARGGAAGMTARSTLTAAVDNNSASQVVTGANTVQGGAFSNAAGIPVVIQNSGANVLIQNATVVQLQLK